MRRFNIQPLNYLNNNVFRTPLVSFFFIVTTFIGCKKDTVTKNDKYYVKYEVNSSTIYFGGKLNLVIKNEFGDNISYTINQRSLWEVTIGPVEKGFVANLKVNAVGETHNKLKLYTSIYFSENNEPFTLKKTDGSDIPRDNVEISYSIN